MARLLAAALLLLGLVSRAVCRVPGALQGSALAPVAQAVAEPTDERRILLDFRNNLTNWQEVKAARGLYGWEECTPGNCISVCVWSGVRCGSPDGNSVVELDLSCVGGCTARLQGRISPEVAYLDYLTELDLSHNAISGPLPALWGLNNTFLSLMELNVNDNQLSGPIPENWGVEPSFNALVDLQLASNNLTGTLPDIFMTSEVSFRMQLGFNLAYNQFSGTLPEFINGFITLDYMSFAGNRFTGTIPPNWGQQEFVFVGEEANFTQAISVLLLHDNQLSGTLPDAWAANGSFTALRTITLNNNRLGGALPASWAALPALESLNVSGAGLGGQLPEWGPSPATLQTIDLASNSLSGTIPSTWSALPALQSMVVQPGNPGLCAKPPPGAAFQLCTHTDPLCLPYHLDTSACATAPAPSTASGFPVAAVAVPVAVVVAGAVAVAGLLLWRRRRAMHAEEGREGPLAGSNKAAGEALWLEAGPDAEVSSDSDKGSRPKSAPPSGGLALEALADNWRMSPEEIELLRHADGSLWQLGSGGFGKVYKARRLGVQPVAVKVLRAPAEAASRLDDAAFAREIAILRACRDPNILQFVGAFTQRDEQSGDSQLCLVTEYMEGGSLQANLRGGHVCWWRRGKQIALDMARALACLHNKRLVHLDCKSSNVLLSRHGVAKLGDLGMARLLADKYVTGAGLVGTLSWSAPEVLLGKRCSELADIFSAGVVLWEIATQETPVRGRMRDPRVPDECPEELCHIIQRCLSPEPAARPSAVELVQLLEQVPGSVRQLSGLGSPNSSATLPYVVPSQPSSPVQAPAQAQPSAQLHRLPQAQAPTGLSESKGVPAMPAGGEASLADGAAPVHQQPRA